MDETGTVEKILPNGEVEITVQRSSACRGCAMNKLCFSDGADVLRVKVKPDFTCKKGDQVRLQIDAGNLVKYSFITYLVPIFLLIVFAILGDYINEMREIESELPSVIGGIFGLIVGLLFVRGFSKRLEAGDKMVVKVLELK